MPQSAPNRTRVIHPSQIKIEGMTINLMSALYEQNYVFYVRGPERTGS